MNSDTAKTYRLFTVREAAYELGVSLTAVYAWLRDGTLRPAQTAGAGRMKYVDGESVFDLKCKRELTGTRS